jgi:folate-binding protein YgfZ
VVHVRGPDAAAYLQGQLSADIDALAVGGSTLALLLEPTGKLCAVLDVRRPGEEDFVLEVDPGAGEVVLARLRRFLLRTDATVEAAGQVVRGEADEVARIRSGWPAFGHEYGGEHSGEVIPAELGQWLVDAAVSFTKGCYTGQELTARVDSRGGNVPRRLRAFESAPGEGARAGDAIVVAGDGSGEVQGRVTSACPDPSTGTTFVMGLVHRRVPDDAPLSVGGQ